MSFAKKHSLGDSVYASHFFPTILTADDSIDITSLTLSKQDQNPVSKVAIKNDEVAEFDEDGIKIEVLDA